MMRYEVTVTGLDAALAEGLSDVARPVTRAMRETVAGLKDELREQVRASGLGARLANTWRGDTYPKSGDALNPAGYLYSKAPAIVDSFERGATIRPLGGKRYLWVPTDLAPPQRGRGARRKMEPAEVAALYDQDFTFIRSKRGQLLACVKVIAASTARGFRRANAKRLGAARTTKLVPMFTLLPAVSLGKRLDFHGATDRWAGRYADLVKAELG